MPYLHILTLALQLNMFKAPSILYAEVFPIISYLCDAHFPVDYSRESHGINIPESLHIHKCLVDTFILERYKIFGLYIYIYFGIAFKILFHCFHHKMLLKSLISILYSAFHYVTWPFSLYSLIIFFLFFSLIVLIGYILVLTTMG